MHRRALEASPKIVRRAVERGQHKRRVGEALGAEFPKRFRVAKCLAAEHCLDGLQPRTHRVHRRVVVGVGDGFAVTAHAVLLQFHNQRALRRGGAARDRERMLQRQFVFVQEQFHFSLLAFRALFPPAARRFCGTRRTPAGSIPTRCDRARRGRPVPLRCGC